MEEQELMKLKVLGQITLYESHDVREVGVISNIGVQIQSQIKKDDFGGYHTLSTYVIPRSHLELLFNKIVDEDLWENEKIN